MKTIYRRDPGEVTKREREKALLERDNGALSIQVAAGVLRPGGEGDAAPLFAA